MDSKALSKYLDVKILKAANNNSFNYNLRPHDFFFINYDITTQTWVIILPPFNLLLIYS